LLRLPDEVRHLLHQGKLSEGHARALLSIGDTRLILRAAAEAVEQQWSVREMEEHARGGRPPARRSRNAAPVASPASLSARKIEDALRTRLGTDVRLTARRKGRGLLSISYYSNDDLARLLEIILGAPFDG
jgi:ParB family chromosome partitioning protein